MLPGGPETGGSPPRFLSCLQEKNSGNRQACIVERVTKFIYEIHTCSAECPMCKGNTVFSKFVLYTWAPGHKWKLGQSERTDYWGPGVPHFSQLQVPLFLPSSKPIYSYKGFLLQLVKALLSWFMNLLQRLLFPVHRISRTPFLLCYLCLWCPER